MRMMAAAALAVTMAIPAQAAVVTRSYTLEASSFANFFNEPSPIASLAIDFTVTFDDLGNGFLGAPDRFTAVTDAGTNAGPFSGTVGFGYFQPNGFSPSPRIGVGGVLNGTNVMLNGTDDFYFVFDASAAGATNAMLSFTARDRAVGFTATDAVVRPATATPAIPEPATWTMMIAGFAAAGAAMRRAGGRRRLLRA